MLGLVSVPVRSPGFAEGCGFLQGSPNQRNLSVSPDTDGSKIARVFLGALSKSYLNSDPFILSLAKKKGQFFLEFNYIDAVISNVNITGLSSFSLSLLSLKLGFPG